MSTPTSIVRVEDVSKRFVLHKDKSLKERVLRVGRSRRDVEDFWALRDITTDIHAGTTVGLIGANGSGKSTLLKIIGAIIQPTTGRVQRRGRLAALLELGAGFHQDLTGRENVYLNASLLGMSRAETDRHFDAIVDFSGIQDFIDTQVKFYSSGMYVRLAFSVAVHVDPDLLLVDEVLAVGDEPFQRKCMDKIRSFQREGRTIALVSHSADQVGELCDRTLFLRDGRIVVDGTPEEGIRALRRSFDVDRREREDAEDADSPSHPRLRIGAVTVRGRDDAPTALLRAGDALRISVDVDLAERVPGWRLGLSIETPRGQYVFGTNSERQDLRLPEGPGASVVEVDVPEILLGAGQYVVRARAWSAEGDTLDLVAQGALFSVEVGSTTSTGVVDMAATMRVRR